MPTQEGVLSRLTTDRQRKIFQAINKSETSEPYKLQGLASRESGYSFGWFHWDMKKRPSGDEYIILDAAVRRIEQGQWNAAVSARGFDPAVITQDFVLERITSTMGQANQYVEAVKSLIDQQLAAPVSVDAIDALAATQTVGYETSANTFVGTLGQGQQEFANTDAFIVNHCDLLNQGGEGKINTFREFLNGVEGELGLDDLVRFRLFEMQYPANQMFRFSNILEVIGVGNISLSQEDAAFFLGSIGELVDNYERILRNPANDGLRDLTLKANHVLSAWYDADPFRFSVSFQSAIDEEEEEEEVEGVFGESESLFTTAQSTQPPPPPGGCPVVLDLDGDGVETTSVGGWTYFDHDANGFAERTGWAGADDGLLAMDRNGDGTINSGRELFGNQTMLEGGGFAANGFQALADLDDNLDGKVDANDAAFSQLKVWQDFDGDGYSSADELSTLDELGITSINTGYTTSSYVDPQGNEHRQVGSFTWADQTTGTATDVWFQTDSTYTIATEWLEVPSDIAALPDIQAFGNVYDLHQAMVRDTSGQLRSLVEQLAAATDPAARASLMDQILFKWTGSDGVNPTARGPNIDARKLAVLETMYAEPFVGVDGPNPNPNAAPLLMQSYNGLFEMFYAQLMAQTHLSDLYGLISYSWDEVSQSLIGDLAAVKTELETRLAADPGADIVAGEFIRSVYGFGAVSMLGLETLRTNETLAWLVDSFGYSSKIQGTDGNDTLSGTSAAEAFRGRAGNDTISGGSANDVLHGQAGDDVLDGAYSALCEG